MPTTIIRRLFGRKGDGKRQDCAESCDCCGTLIADMPAVIYMRTVTVVGFVTIDIYMPLYRDVVSYQRDDCVCGGGSGGLSPNGLAYWSMPFHYKRSAANEFDMCCQVFGLIGACGDPYCTWQFVSYNPMLWEHGVEPKHQEFLTVPTEISCGTTEGSFTYDETIGSSGNQCVNSLVVTQTITISASVPGGTLASPCHNMCCGQPLELYLTVNAPACPDIDGQVVTLKFIGAIMNQGADPTYNVNGTIDVFWEGWLNLPGKCPVKVVVTNNTWSGNTAARCSWTLTIGAGLTICFQDEQFVDGKSYCPPITFSGDWNFDDAPDCEMCCTDPSMTFDLDL